MSSKGLRVIKAAWATPSPEARVAPQPLRADPAPLPARTPVEILEEARRRARALEEQAERLLAEARQAAAAELDRAREEAAALRARAEEEAAALVAGARDEAEALRSAVRAEGWQQGHEEGLAAARAEAEVELARAREAAEAELARAREEAERIRAEALAERDRLLADLEPQLVALALDIARQILRAELKLQPEAVAAMVAAALAKVRGEPEVRLRLHPEDLPGADRHRAQWQSALGGGVELVPDPSLQPGEFVLDSAQGQIDGRLEAQLRQVAAALADLLPPGAAEASGP